MPGVATSKRQVLNIPIVSTATQNLGAGALSLDTTTVRPFALNYVTFNATSPTVQELIITILSVDGPDFDTEILREKICLVNFIYKPDKELSFATGNQIRAEVTNNGAPSSIVNVAISVQEI